MELKESKILKELIKINKKISRKYDQNVSDRIAYEQDLRYKKECEDRYYNEPLEDDRYFEN